MTLLRKLKKFLHFLHYNSFLFVAFQSLSTTQVAAPEIAMIKVVAPNMAQQVVDRVIQAHGGAGVCHDFPLAHFYATARILRLADGPDEVHRQAIARMELKKTRPT